ncbi:zinc-binding dehydrogenase [Phanerochaete sordida]|uniref:Zinc-binding dehydrogenase n=1 Tax=Phanerochaete sordida TaxID=48140 RepID=A0A9P3G425_9APHY|nr:zinc-binding dehydrogenase [Phanerochaete sordida]
MPSAIPATMTAYRYVPSEPNPVAQRIPVPSPTAEQVLVKILAAGVCHSDIGILTPGDALNQAVPQSTFTLGHEGAGIIVQLGSSVASTYPSLKVGDYVALWCGEPCDLPSCATCSSGLQNLCVAAKMSAGIHGLGLEGTWAEYIAVHASSAVPVPASPERVPPGMACAATDAALSPYHALKTCCGVRAGHTVLCIGLGGLGLNAVGIAKRVLGAARVIGCDTRAPACEDARAAGADYAMGPEALLGFIEQEKLAVDVAIDFVGTQATFDACFAAIRPGGMVHLVGLGANEIAYRPLSMMTKDLTLKTSFWGTRAELAEVLQAIADGLLKPMVTSRPMSQCAEVLDEMRAGKVQARIALVPQERLARL